MSSHFFAHLLLVFLLVYADIVYSKVHYITPSLDGPCRQNSSCLTLSQFAADSRSNETVISLLLLPGNHALDRELLLAHLNNFSMTKGGLDDKTVFVECSTHSGRFHISDTIFVSINDLHFIGCGSNIVSRVKWLTITDSSFQDVHDRDTVLVLSEMSNATIVNSSFLSNSLHCPTIDQYYLSKSKILNYVYFQRSTPSGVIHTAFSNISVINSKFMHNRADIGGALVAHNSSLYLARCAFSNNTANFGGVMVTSGSTVFIDHNAFSNNIAVYNGGVMMTYDTFNISSTTYTNNFAYRGSDVMTTFGDSSINILYSSFTNNSAAVSGGVIYTDGSSSFDISNSSFTNNGAADSGGVISTDGNSSFDISNSIFTNSIAHRGGVMIIRGDSLLDIRTSTFTNNSANKSGVVYIFPYASFSIITSIFVNNSATLRGGIIWCSEHGTLKVDNSNFSLNAVSNQGGGLIFMFQCSAHISNSTFDKNNGSLYTFNSNLTFSGYLKFENIAEPLIVRKVIESQEGGAITSFQSTVIFTRESTVHFSNNYASHGGAILATESRLTVYGETVLTNNMADSSGGGISLKQSRLEIKGKCKIVNNLAMKGGGMHVSSSTIVVYINGTLHVINNSAKLGGGTYLDVNPKLYMLMDTTYYSYTRKLVKFSGNHANFGGAVYVADDTNSGACSPNVECFIQALAVYQPQSHDHSFNRYM